MSNLTTEALKHFIRIDKKYFGQVTKGTKEIAARHGYKINKVGAVIQLK